MTRWLSACSALLFLFPAAPALGWGDDGHMLVGSIADKLLEGHPAKGKVKAILGFDLRDAAVWGDCVRSVKRQFGRPKGWFIFQLDPNHPEWTANCVPFMSDPGERRRMEDYVERNWDNCVYIKDHGCHESYHFADVPVLRGSYSREYAGTNDHDVVSAINAAIAKLKGDPVPLPFSIKNEKEALFLLAHFVGDLHQPLHVGGVYLDKDGNRTDPQKPADVKEEEETAGGNFLFFDGIKKMHVIWDDIPNGLGNTADAATLATARAVAPTSGDVSKWAAAWASESVAAASTAFTGLTFTKQGSRHWNVSFENREAYFATVDKIQRERVIMGGARLAELLKAILK